MISMLFWLLSPALLVAASAVESDPACPAEGLGTAACPARDSALLQVRSQNLAKTKLAEESLSAGNRDDQTQILSDEPSTSSTCVRGWGRCGGASWRGAAWTGGTCCVSGYACRYLSHWLSTCLPTYGSGDASTTTPPSQPSSTGSPIDDAVSGVGGSLDVPPTNTVPAAPTVTVPPVPAVSVPPTPHVTVPPSVTTPPTDSYTAPPVPSHTVPPVPEVPSSNLPPAPEVPDNIVPPVPEMPDYTVPPVPPVDVPPEPTYTATPGQSQLPGQVPEPEPLPEPAMLPGQVPEPEPEPLPEPAMPSMGDQGLVGGLADRDVSLRMASSRTSGPCGEAWGKCGGQGFTGPTCCVHGYTCERKDEWYSQCKPAPAPPGDASCAQPWDQCGGKKDGAPWGGPTCCTTGYTCVVGNEWWHSCKPKEDAGSGASPSTTRKVTTAAPATTTARPTTTAAPATTVAAPATTAATTQAAGTHSPGSGQKSRGTLTMWSTQEALGGAQCEFANEPVGMDNGLLPSYLRKGFHCAIGDSSPGFGKGEQCGLCYKITSLSDNGVYGTPGSKGSAVVMVSDGGAGGDAHFDCILDGFKVITGAETGVFNVEFEQVPCDDVTGSPVIINWADQNEWYCKMMFENIGGWGQLDSVQACLDGNCKEMTQFSGATWTGCPHGRGQQMTFTLRQRAPSGAQSSLACQCAGTWPWPTGLQCSCPENFSA